MAKYVAYGEVTFTSSIEPFSVILSNEAQQIVTDSSRVVQSSQEYYTDIIIFQGATERTDFTIGDISSASNITVSKSSNRVTFTVNEGVTLQSDAGTFDIPVLLDDKTVTKTFSWSCAKQGTDGSAAKIVDVTASSQIFKSTDGGATFTPETITLTPTFQGGISYLRWQYSLDGGISWTDVNGSTNGVSVSTGVLTLKNDSTLFTDKISSIPFKCLSDNTSYYDVMTIAKLYDPEDIQNQLTTITNTISGVSSKVDNVEKSIVNKVWQTDITSKINEYNNTTVKEIVDRVTKTETDINGVTTTVSTMKTNYDGQITSLETKQIQTDSKLGWLVSSGTSSSDFTLTDRTAELVSKYINLHGLVTFKGLSSDVNGKFTKYDGWGGTTDSTKINGAMIETGSIKAEQIEANAITATKIAANAVTADKISAYGLSVLHKNTGEKTLEIDASGNVNLNVNSLQIASKDVPTKTEVTQSIKDLQIGGRNLFLKTGIEISNNDYNMATYRPASKPLSAGEIYTATLCVTPAKNVSYFSLYFSSGSLPRADFYVDGVNRQIISETFTMDYAKDMTPDKNIDYANASLYRFPNDGTVTENSTIHWIKIEKGNKATDWTPAPEDLTADVQAKADEALASAKTYADTQIKVTADSINQNVTKKFESTSDETNDKLTELRQEVNSNVEQTGEAIKSSVYEKVYLKDDVDTLLSSVNTEVEQTKTSWQVTFDQLANQLNDYSDGSDAAFDEIRKYIRFEDGNILLGNSSSPLILRIRNDRIQFLQNGYEVAYISDQKMYNTTCEIINQLRIADSAWTVEYNASGDTVISLVGI